MIGWADRKTEPKRPSPNRGEGHPSQSLKKELQETPNAQTPQKWKIQMTMGGALGGAGNPE